MILVVGSSGQVGGHITRQLLNMGKQVRILTRDNPAYQEFITAGAEGVAGDLKDRASLDAACVGIDTIITTATAVERGGEDNAETVDLNGVASLIAAAEAAQVRRFIYISTTAADPTSPTPYLHAKGINEDRLRASNLNYTIFKAHAFLDTWLALAIGLPMQAGAPLTFVGQGNRRHSFLPAQDLVGLVLAVLDHPAAYKQTLVVGGKEPLSFVEIGERVGQLLGRELPVQFVQPGKPIPLVPEWLWGFFYIIESYDFAIDMDEISTTYGVELTSLEQMAEQMFLSG